jgi:putative hydrolase of the HAD superfamily
MKEIKGIIFDLGGVIVGNTSDSSNGIFEYASKILNISTKKIAKVVGKEALRLQIGQETSEIFWERVCQKLKVKCPPININSKFLTKNYLANNHINKQTVAIIHRLKKKYPVGTISNTIAQHAEINKKRKLFNNFDIVILSNEAGLRKPQKEIFELASREMKIPPKNLLFIDDDKRYVKAAKIAGLQSILFKSPKRLESDFHKRGIL